MNPAHCKRRQRQRQRQRQQTGVRGGAGGGFRSRGRQRRQRGPPPHHPEVANEGVGSRKGPPKGMPGTIGDDRALISIFSSQIRTLTIYFQENRPGSSP